MKLMHDRWILWALQQEGKYLTNSILSYLFVWKITIIYTKSIFNRFMASHHGRRPTYDHQISSDGRKDVFPIVRTKSVIAKNKVPNLTNLPHSFKREKFKCIKREDNELNAHLIKYSDIKKEVSYCKNWSTTPSSFISSKSICTT